DADQRRLAGAVGAEQRQNLAAADVEIDRFQRIDAGAVGLAQPADREDRVAHSIGPGSAGAASSFISPWRISIGMLAAANRKVRGSAPHSLNPTQKLVELLRHTSSLSTAMKPKKNAQFRVSLVHPSSFRPG